MLIADAEAAVTEFDARLVQLQRERIRVQVGTCIIILCFVNISQVPI